MEENHNNLGDFLRKRFNDFDEEPGDWAQPDQEVREKVLGQIGSVKKSERVKPARLRIGFLCLLLLVGSGYIFYLQKENAALKEEVQEKTKTLEVIQQQLPMADINRPETNENVLLEKEQKEEQGASEDLTNQSSEIKPNDNTASFATEKKNTFDKNQGVSNHKEKTTSLPLPNQQPSEQSSKVSSVHQTITIPDTTEIQFPIFENSNPAFGGNTKTALAENTTVSKLLNELTIPSLAVSLFPKVALNMPEYKLIPPPLTQPIAQQRPRFEIGYAFSLINFNNQKEVRLGRMPGHGSRVANQQEVLKANGLHLAYSPTKNWWIETGMHYASAQLEHRYAAQTRYDRMGEFIRPDGRRSNQMELESNNSFASEKSTLEVTIPAGETIEDGEFLNLTISESQSLRHAQIPLGIVYQQPSERRLEWQLRGGMLWNHLEFDGYQLAATVESRRGTLEVNAISPPRNKKSQQYLSAYAGMGLNYQLYKQWQLNASVNYQHHFINNNTTASSNAVERGTAFQLALNYRF